MSDDQKVQEVLNPGALPPLVGGSSSAGGRRNLFLLAALGILVIVAGAMTLWGRKDNATSSAVAEPPRMDAVPGKGESEHYAKQVEQENKKTAQAAQAAGKSAVPVLSGLRDVPPPDSAPMQSPPVPTSSRPPSSAGSAANPHRAWLEHIKLAVEGIRERRYGPHDSVAATWVEEEEAESRAARKSAKSSPETETRPTRATSHKLLVARAGERVPALIEVAESPVVPGGSGVVMASLLGRGFEGAKALGKITGKREHLVLLFDTLSLADGRTAKISAVAIDPSSVSPAIPAEVDHHYIERFVLPLAASLIRGLGTPTQTVTMSSSVGDFSTTVSSNSNSRSQNALLEMGKTGSQLLLENAKSVPERELYLPAGTNIHVLFLANAEVSEEIPKPVVAPPAPGPVGGVSEDKDSSVSMTGREKP